MAKIDIALPVFNGEAFLEPAIQSILAQDFEDFRLVISDNASTDRTQEICHAYASDPRVVLHRQATNIGAAPNFNFLFNQTNAPYFKWAASDDLLAPTFLSACLEPLEANAECVLSFSEVQVVGVEGEYFEIDDPAPRTCHESRTERFSELIRFHRYSCYEIFGVFRRSALENTDLIAGYTGGDRNLLAHVCLRGSIDIVPEVLFFARRHPNQSVSMVSDKLKYDVWFDPANAGKARLPQWKRFTGYRKILRQEPLSLHEQLSCHGSLLRQMFVRWRQLGSDIKSLPVSLRR